MDYTRTGVADLVRSSYDQMATTYDKWSPSPDDPRERMLQRGLGAGDPGGIAVDLGCGGGRALPYLRTFGAVVGVDISLAQLAIARARIPTAHYVQSDLSITAFRQSSLAAVICLYALFHVPRDLHPAVLSLIAHWLRPGGRVVFNIGVRDNPGSVDPSWLGVPMYWSNFDVPTNLDLVAQAGLSVEWADIVTEGDESHFWVAAAKP